MTDNKYASLSTKKSLISSWNNKNLRTFDAKCKQPHNFVYVVNLKKGIIWNCVKCLNLVKTKKKT